MIKCPVCKLSTGFYRWPVENISSEVEALVKAGRLDPANRFVKWTPYPLYQRSYEGEPEYISSRCLKCYEKAEKKLLRRLENADT